MNICDRVSNFVTTPWDFAKRIFGRSRTIFLNVVAFAGIVFVEMSDYLTSFNWDELFKHDVALAIGLGVQIVNVILRLNTVAPVNFSKLPATPEVDHVVGPAAE